jgi:hypothetical protein
LHTWPEVASEAVAYASDACKAALAAGQEPEVAAALRDLEQRSAEAGPQLLRFTYRVACQLRVAEARRQILAGVREPAVYGDCAEALFAMEWKAETTGEALSRQALKLREDYIAGLRQEPIKTQLPASLLRPPYIDRLAPVLRAYDQAQRPGRDALYLAMCVKTAPASSESKTLCAGLGEREPEWAQKQLLANDLEGGLAHVAALSPEQRPQLLALLQRFDREQRPGRDRLYAKLCKRLPPPSGELGAACEKLPAAMEGKWAARSHAMRVMAEHEQQSHGGRMLAGLFLGLSLLLLGHGFWSAQRRRMRAA